jgi:hypothetical protein
VILPAGDDADVLDKFLPSFAHGLESRIVLRRDEISFSQGAEWKALISKYIGTIPLSGDASWAAAQSMSGGPPPSTPVSSAMIAKVGAAARYRKSAAPIAALPFSQRIAPEPRPPVSVSLMLSLLQQDAVPRLTD